MTPAQLKEFRRQWRVYRAFRPVCKEGHVFAVGELFAAEGAGLVAFRRSDGKTIQAETFAELIDRALAAPLVVPVLDDDDEEDEAGEAA